MSCDPSHLSVIWAVNGEPPQINPKIYNPSKTHTRAYFISHNPLKTPRLLAITQQTPTVLKSPKKKKFGGYSLAKDTENSKNETDQK
jgi:hypothetical protein